MRQHLTVSPLKLMPDVDRTLFPFSLDHEFGIESCARIVEKIDLKLWKRFIAEDKAVEVSKWNICVVRRFNSESRLNSDSEKAEVLMGYIFGTLRLLFPHRSSRGDFLHIDVTDGAIDVFHISLDQTTIRLEDSELSAGPLNFAHLSTLKILMPWIRQFQEEWNKFYPLYLSMFLNEKACVEQDLRTRLLFRVMALEALFGSDQEFGKKALIPRIQKFVGWRKDLYEQYSSSWRILPVLSLTDSLVGDLYDVRNKIAHADELPAVVRSKYRAGLNYEINNSAKLLEAATAILQLSWRRILEENLQDVFSSKQKMKEFFAN